MFCIYLRTNSDLCHLHHKLIGFYNRDEKCLQRGTDWLFNTAACVSSLKGTICTLLITRENKNGIPIYSNLRQNSYLLIPYKKCVVPQVEYKVCFKYITDIRIRSQCGSCAAFVPPLGIDRRYQNGQLPSSLRCPNKCTLNEGSVNTHDSNNLVPTEERLSNSPPSATDIASSVNLLNSNQTTSPFPFTLSLTPHKRVHHRNNVRRVVFCSGNVLNSYLGGLQFESTISYRVFSKRFFVGFLSLPRRMLVQYI